LNTATGAWTYTLADDQTLSANDSLSDTFTVTGTDDQGATATQDVTITVTGTNDAPQISSSTTATGTVQEDVTATVSGQVVASDIDHDAVLAYSANTLTGAHGSLVLNTATGAWTYTLADDQTLSANDSLSDTFTVTVTDDQGATATQDVTITVTGTNDAPQISSSTTATGTVQEDVTATVSGQVVASDIDHDAVLAYSANTLTGAHGSLVLNTATGAWTYTLADDQTLSANDSLSDTFTVTVTDDQGATATQDVTITVTGTNDAPQISSSTTATGTVQEDVTATVSGQVVASDIDHDAVLAYSANTLTGAHGSLVLNTATGAWTYTLADDQTLSANDSLSDTFTVTVTDDQGATATQDVTITVTGTNDAPQISSSTTATGTVQEDVTATVSGQVVASDIDHDAVLAYSANTLTGAHGSLVLNTATGAWTYTLADDQTLSANDSLSDTFTVTVTDDQGATATQDVTITVTGTNDAPQISSSTTATGTVQEDVTATVSGQVVASDIDHDAVLAYSANTLTGAHGSLVLNTATGAWTYTLADDQTLSANDSLSDTFTVTVTDDQGATATQDVTITVTGTNDAPQISSSTTATGTVQEDVTATVSGQVVASDIDHDAVLAYSANTLTGAHGSLVLNTATGAWTYTLADDQTLSANDSLSDTFTVTVTDDQGATATQDVTITVTGTNDAPQISSSTTATGTVQEDVTATVSGQVVASDIDHDAVLAYSANTLTGAHGSLVLNTATGAWTYTLADDQTLSANDSLSDTFTVTVTDDQ